MPAGIDGCAQEIRHRDARDGNRVLECQEQAQAGAFVRRQFEQILILEPDFPARNRYRTGVPSGYKPGWIYRCHSGP